MSPDTALKAAAYVAAHTSTLLNRTNTLFSHGHGTPSISETASQMLHHGDDEVESCLTDR